jgi:PAS domain S-box-containing protein
MIDEQDHEAIFPQEIDPMELAFLASIIKDSDDAIIGKTLDGTIVSWNAAAEKMYGFSAKEAIGQPIRIVVPPDRHDEVTDFLSRIRRSETIKHYETERMTKSDGQIHVSVTVSPIKSASGEIVGASTIARDISDRKRAQAFQRASAYTRSLIEASLDPLVTINVEGKITDVNMATERVTGCSRNELIGTEFADYFTDHHKARSGYQQVFKDGSVKDYELEIRHKNGSLTPVMYNASLYRDESGEITGIFAAARDISDLKQAEQKLAAHATNLELVNSELEQFTYVASHDLQEPLRKLISFSELLREDLGEDLPERADVDLGFITDAAARMKTLVQDLLTLSRTGRAAVKRERIPLDECADAAIEALSHKIEETGAELGRDRLPEIVGDRTLLTELYQNLIGNALHYKGNSSPKIHLTSEKTGQGWVLGVRDNGIGIRTEYLSQIFLPFKRLHTRKEYEGSGIGLSICRKVVNLCGGKIWAESEGEGRGAHFKFTLNQTGENSK